MAEPMAVDFERFPTCFWHICPEAGNRGEPCDIVKRERDYDVLRCVTCGTEGRLPVGARPGRLYLELLSPSPGEGRPKRGRCEGCGEEVEIDHGMPGAYGHTRSEHHPDCDGSCFAGKCPVPVACGPVYVPGGGRPGESGHGHGGGE